MRNMKKNSIKRSNRGFNFMKTILLILCMVLLLIGILDHRFTIISNGFVNGVLFIEIMMNLEVI